MKIIEKYILGKAQDQQLCEDGLFVSDDMIMVVDGVTSKGSMLFEGKSSGRYCKDLILELAENTDFKNITAESFLNLIDKTLSEKVKNQFGDLDITDYPRACLIAYNKSKNEVWSYGDCQCMINGKLFANEKAIDTVTSNVRSFYLTKAVLQGATTDELIQNDVGRNAIMDMLKAQFMFENKDCEWGYPVINGQGINLKLLKTYHVCEGDEVILASDGYPVLKHTLRESEEELERILKEDPMCFNEFKTTKGVKKGNNSFDDRTYCRFVI